jgi:3-oxoacyl-[acyl-carrier protein] reductase
MFPNCQQKNSGLETIFQWLHVMAQAGPRNVPRQISGRISKSYEIIKTIILTSGINKEEIAENYKDSKSHYPKEIREHQEEEMGRLENRVAVVTGGARGLGKLFSLTMAEEGAKVVIADILKREAQETTKEIEERGGSALSLKVDVTSEEETRMMAEETIAKFGRLDILINNAAMFYGLGRRPFWEIPVSEWDQLMSVNLKGPFLCTKAVVSQMKKQNKGKIINLSSETAFTGSKGFLHYVTSKGGIISFTRSLAAELGPYGICVNSIAPGLTKTEAAGTISGNFKKYDVSLTPLGRLEQPQDLVGAVIFFASDESDFVTGQALVIDGGRYMH